MKIGIVGPAERALAWEEHIRPHRTVEEVIIAPRLEGIGTIDACFLLDETSSQLQTLLDCVQAGIHTFLIAPLPTDRELIEKVYHASEEANVLLQFSHWPSLAPSSQWIAQKIIRPKFIQINREINYTDFLESKYNFEHYWINELAFSLKWIDGTVHKMDINTATLGSSSIYNLHLFLRFDNGATANIFVNSCADQNKHNRFIADTSFIADCNVLKQHVRLGEQKNGENLFFEKKRFDSSLAAKQAATKFIKAIQLNKSTVYNSYDLFKLCRELKQINRRIHKIN